MSKVYDHKKIEKKWQNYWKEKNIYQTDKDLGKKKKYILDMFPYPSGAGLHVGHPLGYIASDILSRYYKMKGYRVLHPMGWDAFGLPAENYAIKSGIHPAKSTKNNISVFKRQMMSLGFSYDWSREIDTSSPEYFKWTQWIFLKLYNMGLAYKKIAPVNWCVSCQTVLANEQVVDGKCERCKKIVIQKELDQWFFNITNYAEELLDNIGQLDWSESIKNSQRNWIGKSEGAAIKFEIIISNHDVTANKQLPITKQIINTKSQKIKQFIEVFTTRPDTLYGATYLVLAPENELILKIKNKISNIKDVEKYINKTRKKTDLQRTDLGKEKTGVELKGVVAINPVNGKELPIWIADYVLSTYGTGAIMAVPAHDERDFEFAKKYNLEIINVIKGDKLPFIGNGTMVNSGKFNGQQSNKILEEITQLAGGKMATQFKLRDWLVSRQRYWGAPIPIIYCDKCGTVPVPEDQLPVELPTDVDFKPTGESPLVKSKTFHEVKCPKCHIPARRESDTMDTFVDSSWYFLAYIIKENSKFEIRNSKLINDWMPVDIYVGGAEHAVLHLLYSRFITKALRDMGVVNIDEPFISLKNQGTILAQDGKKMSKSLGNVINPDEIVEIYGADTFRLYEMFMGPFAESKKWSTKNIAGVNRFIKKVYRLSQEIEFTIDNSPNIKSCIENLKIDIEKHIENLLFNTAISKMMVFINQLNEYKKITRGSWIDFLKIFSLFAPHLSDELYNSLGEHKSLYECDWFKTEKVNNTNSSNNIPIQINGKVKMVLNIDFKHSESEIKKHILSNNTIKANINNQKIKKFIIVPSKIINIVLE